MIRAYALLRRKPGITRERFREWLLVEHPRLGFKVPGLASYEVSFVEADAGSETFSISSKGSPTEVSQELPYDAVVELSFDFDSADEALHAWRESTEAKGGREDTEGFTADVTRLVVGDRMLLLDRT